MMLAKKKKLETFVFSYLYWRIKKKKPWEKQKNKALKFKKRRTPLLSQYKQDNFNILRLSIELLFSVKQQA